MSLAEDFDEEFEEDEDAPLDSSRVEEIRTFEDILHVIGACGKWQMWVWFWEMLFTFFIAFSNYVVVFLIVTPQYICIDTTAADNGLMYNLTQNASISDDQCYQSNGDKCTDWEFQVTDMRKTVATEWNLVCDRAILVQHIQLTYMLGDISCSILAGTLSDRFGRKRVIIVGTLSASIVSLLLSFAPTYGWLLAARYLMAFSLGFLWSTTFVLASEITTGKYRSRVGGAFWAPYSIGPTLLCLVAYLTREWRRLCFIISLPMFISVLYPWILPESPRWLLAKGRAREAERVLKWAARWNGTQLPDSVDFDAIANQLSDESHREQAQKANLLCIFRYRALFVRTLISAYCWFACGLGFFGVSLYASSLAGDVFLNNALVAVVEIPGFVLPGVLLNYVPRKYSFSALVAFASVMMLVVPFLPDHAHVATVIMAMLGKWGVASAWGVLCVYTAELYPTSIRTACFSVSMMCAGIGAMISPYIAAIHKIFVNAGWLSMFIMGVVAMPAAILVLFQPETRGKKMVDHVEDAFGKHRRSTIVARSALHEQL